MVGPAPPQNSEAGNLQGSPEPVFLRGQGLGVRGQGGPEAHTRALQHPHSAWPLLPCKPWPCPLLAGAGGGVWSAALAHGRFPSRRRGHGSRWSQCSPCGLGGPQEPVTLTREELPLSLEVPTGPSVRLWLRQTSTQGSATILEKHLQVTFGPG